MTAPTPNANGDADAPAGARAEIRPTLERIWLTYLGCVVLIAVAAPGVPGGGEGAASVLEGAWQPYEPFWFVFVHVPVLLVVLATAWVARRFGHERARWLRVGLAIGGLPVVFSALCWLLPAVHPEPYEFTFQAFDRALLGDDAARLAGGLPPWFVELLQLDYASFYLLCIAAVVAAGCSRGFAAFDRGVVLLVFGFLVSYLGYLLFPTIGPKLVLDDLEPLEGVWWTEPVRAWIEDAETSHWDCFPSGHTMLTLTSLIVLWRWARRWFWVLLLPALLLIASTVLLRYHWLVDVLAGAALAYPCVRLADHLLDRDGAPAVRPQ